MYFLLTHALLEVVARSFYARQQPKFTLIATLIRTVTFLIFAVLIFKTFGVFGIALVDSITVAMEVLILIFFLRKGLPNILDGVMKSFLRIGGGILISAVVAIVFLYFAPLPSFPKVVLALVLATLVYLPFTIREIRLLLRL